MSDAMPIGFNMEPVTLAITALALRKTVDARVLKGKKFARILASIREVGLIEMPLIYRQPDGQYMLVDGHLRIEALKQLGVTQVRCLITHDEERHSIIDTIAHLVPIQEHYMIRKAIEHGVSEERLARAMQVDIKSIQAKCQLLQGIGSEAVRLLENTPVSAQTMQQLKKVKPERQLEIAEIMTTAGNFTSTFCRGLVLATKKHLLVEMKTKKKATTVDYTELVKMQEELESLQREMQVHEDSYGQNFLNLVVVRGYLAKLLANERVNRLLDERYHDLAGALRQVVESVSLEG